MQTVQKQRNGYVKRGWQKLVAYWHKNLGHKFILVVLAIFIVGSGTLYGLSRWYVFKHRNDPYKLGVTFIPGYAESLGVDPQETLDALINDLGIRRFRLVTYWRDIEPNQGAYNFSQLDWQFKKIEEAGGKITLAVGLRQPRWPECHTPEWALHTPDGEWQAALQQQILAVVERYKNSPALIDYQLENEALLKVFGECTDYDRDRMDAELQAIKKADPNHPVIMSRSNNIVSLPLGKPQPDAFAFSIYRRVWDKTLTKRYFQYPFPSWYYASIAAMQELFQGKTSYIHELQMEPWPPKFVTEVSLEEQSKSFDAPELRDRVDFAKNTGMHTMDLWGGEYWYYRKVILGDNSVWEAAREVYKNP